MVDVEHPRRSGDYVPLIAHVLYKMDVGGLENGLVNLINHSPADRYRHAVVCLTDYTDFAKRIGRPDVMLYSLRKAQGNNLKIHAQLWQLFRQLRPSIVHTRNLSALDALPAASLAGTPVRIHSEHGRDIDDLHGRNRKQQWIRRLYSPLVHHYIALSCNLADYLTGSVGINASRVTQLYNGVDTEKFRPAAPVAHSLFADLGGTPFIVGTVGRMHPVKDQPTLVKAFIRAVQIMPTAKADLRLMIIGDGELRADMYGLLDAAGVAELAALPGSRTDVPELMRRLSLFVLPSLAEGISNTVLEAMASALPVIATRVGGNPELVIEGQTGNLVEAQDVESMAHSILDHYRDPGLCERQGRAGRIRVLDNFSLSAMVAAYCRIYDHWLMKRCQGLTVGASQGTF